MGEQPQVIVFMPYPRPAPNVGLALRNAAAVATAPAAEDSSPLPPITVWNDDLDRRLWSCASLYPHNSVQWDVVARKLNTSPDQCIIRFLHLYQQQLHRQLLAQRRPSRGAVQTGSSSSSSTSSSAASPPSSSLSSAPLSSSPSAAADVTSSFGTSPSAMAGAFSGPPSTGRASASPAMSQQLSSSPTSTFAVGHPLSSSPSQQAPLFAYAAKYAQQQQPVHQSGGSTSSPWGSPASSLLLAKHKSGEQSLSRMTWPSKREFFDCVERLNFEWLSIGRALNQNPYECRQLYLAYSEGANLPQHGIADVNQLEIAHDPLLSDLYGSDRAEPPQLFQPLHPQSPSPTFALDDEEAITSPMESVFRSTSFPGSKISASLDDDEDDDEHEQGDAPWLASASIDQSTLASAFMSTFLTDRTASDE